MTVASLHLTAEELRETLDRARQLAAAETPEQHFEETLEPYIHAAEEMGIPRNATLQALRERLATSPTLFAVGELVFAPSLDGHWYPARITDVGGGVVRVAFVAGGEHECPLADLRRLTLVPGRKVSACLKTWGWCDAVVVSQDRHKNTIEVEWAGSREHLPLEKLRLTPRLANPQGRRLEGEAGEVPLVTWRVALFLSWASFMGGLLAARWLAPFLPFLR